MIDPEELKDFLDDHVGGATDFQLTHFVIGSDRATPYGSYKQAVREIERRARGLEDLADEIRIARLEREDLLETASADDSRPGRIAAIRAGMAGRKIERLERKLAETDRELALFVKHARRLKQSVGRLTPERREELETRFWEAKVRFMADLDILFSGRPSRKAMEMAFMLPEASRERALKAMGLQKTAPDALPGPEPEQREP